MTTTQSLIDFDRLSGSSCVLLTLHQQGELQAKDLLRQIAISQDTFYKRTGPWLQKQKLIEVRPNIEKRIFKYTLTPKGKQVAELLEQLEKLL